MNELNDFFGNDQALTLVLRFIFESINEKNKKLDSCNEKIEKEINRYTEIEKKLLEFEEKNRNELFTIFPDYQCLFHMHQGRPTFLCNPLNEVYTFIDNMIRYPECRLPVNLRHLFDIPWHFSDIITHHMLEEKLNISLKTAKRAIEVLINRGIIERKRIVGGQIYGIVNKHIFTILENENAHA